MSIILVTGSASGLGKEIFSALEHQGHNVYGYDVKFGNDVLNPDLVSVLGTEPKPIDVLINCAGVNEIDWLQSFEEEQWDHVMGVNAKGIFKMSQACLPMLIESKGTILNIVSNAAHVPMTCSLAYNASKGAAHIMTLQLARELTKKYGITVFGVAPNKLSGTEMSKSIDEQVMRTRGWSKEFAQKYQLNGLLTGEETPVSVVANFIVYMLDNKLRHKYLSGCVIPYGA